MKYLVVIGDIISSREIEDRKLLQLRLNNILNEIKQHEDAPLSPYTITLGDEFQAVYQQADSLFLHAFSILEEVFPHRIRFSFGLGNISTELNREQSLGMDGEAFYLAREGMEWIKEQRGEHRFIIQGLAEPQTADLLNNTLFLISNQINSWQLNRISILRRRMENQAVKKIAEDLGISETAVYRNIYDGSLREIIRIFHLIASRIDEQLGGES